MKTDNISAFVNGSMTTVRIGDRVLHFSYSTCIAYSDGKGRAIRRDTSFSKTTAGHMTKLGVKGWAMVSDEEFDAAVLGA